MSARVPVPTRPAGWRLQEPHYSADRVPIEVARYGMGSDGDPDRGRLPVGSPGKVGVLELDFALRGPHGAQRTELVHHYQKAPLQIMRPLYYNPQRADMPYTYLLTTGGGILHGDRQRTDLRFERGSSAHVTTQAHTKLYRMDTGYASALVNIEADAGAYAEYLPDPVIPFAGARFYQRTTATVHEEATLLAGETIYAGRLSRGERNAYDVLASDMEVRRPDGHPIVLDRSRLVPDNGRVGGLAVLDDHDVVSTLYVISPLASPARIAEALQDAVAGVVVSASDTRFGVSTLPGDAGAWLRLVSDDTITALAAHTAAAAAVHELLTGRPAPRIRKS